MDHVAPRSEGGQDFFENLAASCRRCNGNKGNATVGLDRVTGLPVRLFDPRRDAWTDHFRDLHGAIVGTDPIGRATAAMVFRRTPQFLPEDIQWTVLDVVQNERLWEFLRLQRARRLGNKFRDLQRGFEVIPFLAGCSQADADQARFAATLLLVEMMFTRASHEDVVGGLKVVQRALGRFNDSPSRVRSLLGMQSILEQQHATMLALTGRSDDAAAVQQKSAQNYEVMLDLGDRPSVSEALRLETVRAKYTLAYGPGVSPVAVSEGEALARAGLLEPLTYLADANLGESGPSSHADRVLAALDEALMSLGYGQDYDHAHSVVRRRRWWGLRLVCGHHCDLDLFNADIEYWKSIHMENEIRELLVVVRRAMALHRSRTAPAMERTLLHHLAASRARRCHVGILGLANGLLDSCELRNG